MTKHGGLTGFLESAGLVTTDDPVAPATEVTTPAPTPMPMATVYPTTFVPAHLQVVTTATPTLTPEDESRRKAMEAQIYATPTSYVTFNRVWEKLHYTPDLNQVFDILVAANPGMTPAHVLSDVEGHLAILANQKNVFEVQLAKAKAERVDGVANTITSLQQANQTAMADIAKRNDQIGKLTNDKATAEKSIADGEVRFSLVQSQLAAPLLQAKQMLSSMTQTTKAN